MNENELFLIGHKFFRNVFFLFSGLRHPRGLLVLRRQQRRPHLLLRVPANLGEVAFDFMPPKFSNIRLYYQHKESSTNFSLKDRKTFRKFFKN